MNKAKVSFTSYFCRWHYNFRNFPMALKQFLQLFRWSVLGYVLQIQCLYLLEKGCTCDEVWAILFNPLTMHTANSRWSNPIEESSDCFQPNVAYEAQNVKHWLRSETESENCHYTSFPCSLVDYPIVSPLESPQTLCCLPCFFIFLIGFAFIRMYGSMLFKEKVGGSKFKDQSSVIGITRNKIGFL